MVKMEVNLEAKATGAEANFSMYLQAGKSQDTCAIKRRKVKESDRIQKRSLPKSKMALTLTKLL